MKKVVPKLGVRSHGLNYTVQAVVSMQIRKKIIGKACGIIHKGIVGAPVKIQLEGTTKADAVSMFVHAVKEETTEEDPGRGGRTTALPLTVNRRLVRGGIEGER